MSKKLFNYQFMQNRFKWFVINILLFSIMNFASAQGLIKVGFYCNVIELGPGENSLYYTYAPYTVNFGGATQGSTPQGAGYCEYPANIYNGGFATTLTGGAGTAWTITCPKNAEFCFGGTAEVVFSVDDACSGDNADIYVNGAKTNSYYFDESILSSGAPLTVNVSVVPKNILFQWDYPAGGVQALTADGQSQISGTASNGSPNITWSIAGDALGCTLLLSNGPNVVVQSGTNTGTINVTATDPVGGTCCTQPLKLVNCSSGGCAACQAGGGLSVGNNCVELKVGLGWALEGNTADYLHIKEESPSAAIATPADLHYDFHHVDVEVYTNSSGLAQIKTPQMFVNIVTNSSSEYSILFYNLTNVLSDPINNGGYYLLTNSPYRTITVQNPSGNTNEVLMTDSNDGSTYDFTWQTNGWLLTTGGGLRNELRTTVSSNNLSIVTTTISTGSSAPIQTRIETWAGIPTNSQRLIQEVNGSGSAARTNNYSYTTNGFLQQVVRSDGSWEYYVYDSYNRPVDVYSGFLNQGVTTNMALCRLTVNDYSTNQVSGSGDTGLTFFLTPRCSIQYVLGQEVSRKYFIGLLGQRKDIQCVNPGATWNDPGNLVTTYNLFTSGYRLNEPWQIIHPDGTADIYSYQDGTGVTTTNVTWTGHLDGTGTNVDDGTETIIISGPTGLTLSKTVIDIKSSIVTAQEMYSYDSLNRLTVTTYLDGTYIQNTYDCCTISSQQGRDGTMTSFSYDALKRLLTTTVNGIITSNIYDPAGNILGTVRIGTDGSSIATSQTSYDTAGQQTSTMDALGHTTFYTNYFDGSGQSVKQTTYPDSSTRIETYYQDQSLQSITGTAGSPSRSAYGVESDGGFERAYNKTIQLDASYVDTADWIKTYTDGAGHAYKTVYADNNYSQSVYNTNGQLSAQIDPDGVTTLYQYDDQGRQTFVAADLNTNGIIDFSGADRITETLNDFTNDHGMDVSRSRTYVWKTGGSSISNLVAMTETSVDGDYSWNVAFNGAAGITNSSYITYDPADGYAITTAFAPDGSTSITTNQNNRVISMTQKYFVGSIAIPVSQTTYGYDVQGRQNTVTDARNGTTTTYFNGADQAVATLTPSPDGVQNGLLTTNILDSMGRTIKTTQPDGTSVTNVYYSNGALEETYGSRTYPVAYTYDSQGRMKTMTTWTNFATGTGAAITTWNYDGYRGFMINKAYADGNGPSYSYTPAGRLHTRTWARGVVTTYQYDNAGSLQALSYSDSTSQVNYGYDRLGRQTTVTNGTTVCNWTFNDAGQALTETYTAGLLNGLSISNSYDSLFRRQNLSVLSGASTLAQTAYGYDVVSRLANVSDGTNSAVYTYLANSPLVGDIAFQHNGQTVMTTTKQYDYLNRLTAIQNTANYSPVASFNYNYNTASQRTSVTNADSSYWVYQYDSLGQVTAGKKYWADGTPVAGQQFTYNFDDIGNRKTTASGGDASGANLRSANYTANNLNQVTSRDIPGYVDVLGSANPSATVTANLQRAYRYGSYFQDELNVNNASSAQWVSLTNLAVLNNGTNADIIATNNGSVYVAQTPEQFRYDADGNLTNDGRWSYVWDGENRLIQMTVNTNVGLQYTLTFAYDDQGRRIQKLVSTNNINIYTNRFLYDSWNLVAEVNPASSLIRNYMWGNDLSGSMQGAGGVGGLLQMSYHGLGATNCFSAFDGNGNIVALVGADDGSIVATYEYSPFGEMIRSSGRMASLDPIRFSTKYNDDESTFLYYGFRYYKPAAGAWLSRDPIEERGDINLYSLTANYPVNRFDRNGFDFAEMFNGYGMAPYPLPPSPQPAPPDLGFFGGAWNWVFSGHDVHVPFSDYDPGWGPSDFDAAGWKAAIQAICHNCGSSQTFNSTRVASWFSGQSILTKLSKGGPGRISVVLKGQITSSKQGQDCGCKWQYHGTVTIPPDAFDFNPEAPGVRPIGAEIITDMTRGWQIITHDGFDFTVYFDGNRSVNLSGDCSSN